MKGFAFGERYEPALLLSGLVLGVRDLAGDSLGPDDRLPKGAELVLVIGERTERQVALPDPDWLPPTPCDVVGSELLQGRWRWSRPAPDAMDTLRAVISRSAPRVCAGPRGPRGVGG